MLRHMKLKTLENYQKVQNRNSSEIPSRTTISTASSFSSESTSSVASEDVSHLEHNIGGLNAVYLGPKQVKALNFLVSNRIISSPLATTHTRKREMDSSQDGQIPKIPTIVNIVEPAAKRTKRCHGPSPIILATPQDAENLNSIHCFVRKHIEVFAATDYETSAPCPGRKAPLVLGQVGLRCIHCKAVHPRLRTKRAVCYPRSISRVYNCVSDMKFDHFSNCNYLPVNVKEEFEALNQINAAKGRVKGSNNTAKFYYDSAVKLGMQDKGDYVTLNAKIPADTIRESSNPYLPQEASSPSSSLNSLKPLPESVAIHPAPQEISQRKDAVVTSSAFRMNNSTITDRCLLATPIDKETLNPIHCFVRQNVEAFIANEEDVSAPRPGRKQKVFLGQVGIRCIRCKHLSPKNRVKRAICYPPTISNLYHAVSNMKFDHFGACKGLSAQDRQEFCNMKNMSKRKSKGNASSTAKYYEDSAKNDLGLVDTADGIRVKNNSFVNAATATDANDSPTPSTILLHGFSLPSLPSRSRSPSPGHHSFNSGSSMEGMEALIAATEYEEQKINRQANV